MFFFLPFLIPSSVVYICGPLDTFLNIMKLFQSEIQDPQNYAIFYLDVFAESLADRRPWQNSDPEWADPINVFKVPWRHTHTCTSARSLLWINWDSAQLLCRFIECGLSQFLPLCNRKAGKAKTTIWHEEWVSDSLRFLSQNSESSSDSTHWVTPKKKTKSPKKFSIVIRNHLLH